MFITAKLHFIFKWAVSLFHPKLSQKRPNVWKYPKLAVNLLHGAVETYIFH